MASREYVRRDGIPFRARLHTFSLHPSIHTHTIVSFLTRFSPKNAMKGRSVVPLMRRESRLTPAVWKRILFLLWSGVCVVRFLFHCTCIGIACLVEAYTEETGRGMGRERQRQDAYIYQKHTDRSLVACEIPSSWWIAMARVRPTAPRKPA